jgi:hypothetical protein
MTRASAPVPSVHRNDGSKAIVDRSQIVSADPWRFTPA